MLALVWRRVLRIGGLVLVALTLLLGNRVGWYLAKKRALDVVVVDKTVPFARYREHEALAWLLRAERLVRPDGGFLDPARDYLGFDPREKRGRELRDDDLTAADVLFVADTYGVYRGDYEQEGEVAALERSPKIYGGFDDAEAQVVERYEARGGLVIAEFNTFASPTEKPARERLERVFGVRWTDWVARFWPNLGDANEVPKWLGRLHERVAKGPLGGGAAFVLVHGDDDIVVLRTGEDLLSEVVTQERTPAGAAYDLPERGTFWFWMDLVQATDAEVLYEHTFHVTEAGKAKLASHGLGTRFPALVRRRNAYYFAGDFVDVGAELDSPERYGLVAWKARTSGCGGGSVGTEGYFWGWYAPIVTRLLSSRAR